MKYMGSKRRIAKYILPIILRDRESGKWYIEPFVGGANIIDKVDGNRIGSDINYYTIMLLKALQNGWSPPEINEEKYCEIKKNKHKYEDHLVGYAGTQLTYSAKWFDSYRRDKTGKRDYSSEAKRNVLKQAPNLKGIEFFYCNYFDLVIPPESIVYCDPPYKSTTKYKDQIDYDYFYNWCRSLAREGHQVFVSEYQMPDDFECLWSKDIHSSLTKQTGAKRGVEKLFKCS